MKTKNISINLFTILCFSTIKLLAGCEGGCVSDGGCSWGTLGEEEKVIFDFKEVESYTNMSEDSGNAFSSGTTVHLGLFLYENPNEGGNYPPLSSEYYLETSNENVISIDDILENETYKYVLGMNNEGSAELIVKKKSDNKVFDSQKFRVADPDGIYWYMLTPNLESNGEKIFLASGGNSCIIEFYPYELKNNEKNKLYGSYHTTIDENCNANFTISDDSLSPPIQTISIEPSQIETCNLTINGPKNIRESISIESISINSVSDIEIQLLESETPDEYRAGQQTGVSAYQKINSDYICGGFEIIFSTPTPDIIEIVNQGYGLFGTYRAIIQFKAPGNGIITASLKDNPSLQNSINITVQPAQ